MTADDIERIIDRLEKLDARLRELEQKVSWFTGLVAGLGAITVILTILERLGK